MNIRVSETLRVFVNTIPSAVVFWIAPPVQVAADVHEPPLPVTVNPQTPVVFKINMAAGHGGASGRYDYLREIAFDYSYILTRLGRHA